VRPTTGAAAIGAALLAGLPAACSDAGSGSLDEAGTAECPSLVRACPRQVPSYAHEVEPLLANRCVVCHSPYGGYGFDEETHAEVAAQSGAMLTQVADCMMPPSGMAPLTTAERQALLDWLVCGAPDN